MVTSIDPMAIHGYDSGDGWGIEPGQIISVGWRGFIQCRMCHGFNEMNVYKAVSGSYAHYFGLHETCGRAYFARRKIEDWGKFWDDVDLLTVVLLPQRHGVFDNQ